MQLICVCGVSRSSFEFKFTTHMLRKRKDTKTKNVGRAARRHALRMHAYTRRLYESNTETQGRHTRKTAHKATGTRRRSIEPADRAAVCPSRIHTRRWAVVSVGAEHVQHRRREAAGAYKTPATPTTMWTMEY